MLIEDTRINGVKIIKMQPICDERGYFVREFCQKELVEIKAEIIIEQINHSMTQKKGSVRGLHFQYPPHAELKIVRCIKGSIFDVAVDLRKNSPTYLQLHEEILSADNMKALIVPEGCAHGFQTLEDNVELLYFHTESYCKEAEGTVRYDDPTLGIKWPLAVENISEKDVCGSLIGKDFKEMEI